MTHDEIRELLSKITPGEWIAWEIGDVQSEQGKQICDFVSGYYNRQFIAASPTIVRQLLEENEQLRAHQNPLPTGGKYDPRSGGTS